MVFQSAVSFRISFWSIQEPQSIPPCISNWEPNCKSWAVETNPSWDRKYMTLMDPLFSWCSSTLKGTNIPTKRKIIDSKVSWDLIFCSSQVGICIVFLFQQKTMAFKHETCNVHHVYLLCPPQTVSNQVIYRIIALVSIELSSLCTFNCSCLALTVLPYAFVVDFDMPIWIFPSGRLPNHLSSDVHLQRKTTVSISVRCTIPATKLKRDQFRMCAGFGRFSLLPNLTPNSDCTRFASGEKRLRQGKFKNPPGCWFLRRCRPRSSLIGYISISRQQEALGECYWNSFYRFYFHDNLIFQ